MQEVALPAIRSRFADYSNVDFAITKEWPELIDIVALI